MITASAKQTPSDGARQVTDIRRHVEVTVTPGDRATLSELLARLTVVEHDPRTLLVLVSSLLATILVDGA